MVLRQGNGLGLQMLVAWIVRALLLLGGALAGFFVTKDATNYPIMAFVIAVFIFVSCIALIAYEDTIMLWAKGFFSKNH